MMKKLYIPLLLIFLSAPLLAKPVSLETLLDEMIDRDVITRFPEPAYVCVQASSYDRAAKSPTENWFANGDASQFIRDEMHGNRKEWVLMDAEGPGAIVRWWITAPHYKVVFRIYLDGSDTPTIEANIGDLIGGNYLAGAPLSEVTANGRNLYLPIPYAKHCKVTVDDMPVQENLYYQINYRNYAKGTEVKTFTMKEHAALKRRIDRYTLTDVIDPLRHLPTLARSLTKVIRKGETQTLRTYDATRPENQGTRSKFSGLPYRFTKGRMLTDIFMKVHAPKDQYEQALRSTVLSITFDGKETVWCPLGDFFGSGVGINPYKSWYTWVEKDGSLFSRWQMPFKETMQVKLINYGTQDIEVEQVVIVNTAYKWDNRSMYFHADWRQERNIETIGGNGTKDWNYVKIKGKGVFVGDVLSVLNRNPAWWGEGDEKIYVDGETFPSHFGTGTEDYYGYAWCTPEFFESPFHFQPRAEGPSNYGNTTNGRVRLLDGIPFTKDFRFDMEVWHWARTKIDYSVVNFWYGFDGAQLVDFQSRKDQIEEGKSPVSYKTPLMFDIPGFKIEKMPTGGTVQVQTLQQFTKEGQKWDNDDHLWWTGARPGAKLELILEVEKDGTYKLVGELTKARDYGNIQFSVNGVKVGGIVDLYNPEVVPTGAMEIGSVELKAGKQVVQIEIVGKNDAADAGYLVGIDKLSLVP
jgi:hypothetical protein